MDGRAARLGFGNARLRTWATGMRAALERLRTAATGMRTPGTNLRVATVMRTPGTNLRAATVMRTVGTTLRAATDMRVIITGPRTCVAPPAVPLPHVRWSAPGVIAALRQPRVEPAGAAVSPTLWQALSPAPVRRAAWLGTMLLAAVGLASPTVAQERVVNIYNWTDYTDPDVLARFTAETGIKVRYDVFDSLETLEGKLLAGRSGYDIVVPSNEPTFSRLIRAGALAEIDRDKVPNWRNLDPGLMQRVEASDPGNRHGAIYLWGTIGMGLNPERVRAAAPDAPTDSWALLFRPENARRIAQCGITMMDSAIDVIPSVLRYLGKNPDSTEAGDLAAVEATLMAIRPYIRNFASGGALEALASGETCLAFDYSGDVIQAGARAGEAGRGVVVRYVAPREGVEVGFDMLAIPADAPHRAEALAFINYTLRPDVIAAITNKVRYPNAVPASDPMIQPALKADTNVFPTPAQMAGFFTIRAVPQAAERARSRMWARFKGAP